MSSDLQSSIIKTLAYFDLSDYPLTKEELFSFLWSPPTISYLDFLLSLRGVTSDEAIPLSGDRRASLAMTEKFGYYFLPGREEIVEIRRRKLLISAQKLKIARRAAKIIWSVPFLRAVFVCNTTGSEQASEDSDIDFFIVTEKNRIWITRLFVTFLLSLFGLRRAGKRIKNKICLSFYVTTASLDLAKWRVADDDVHFAYWLNQMLPIFDPDNYYAKFLQANSWTKIYLPNINLSSRASRSDEGSLSVIPRLSRFSRIEDPDSLSGGDLRVGLPATLSLARRAGVGWLIGQLWKKAWEKMWQGSYGDIINNQAKQIQLSKMKFSGKQIDRGEDKGVVISDEVLKFHEKDTRIEYRDLWQKKVEELSL